MGLNDESYLDDLLRAVTAEDNKKKEQMPLNVLEESELSNNGLIDDSEDDSQNDTADNEFSSDDLTQMLKNLEQIEDEPIHLEDGMAEVGIENFPEESEGLFFGEQEEEPPAEEELPSEEELPAEEELPVEEELSAKEESLVEEELPVEEEIPAKVESLIEGEPFLEEEQGEEIQGESAEDTLAESMEDYDLNNLLVDMEEDEELAEVNDLLQKDENHEAIDDDDLLEMLERASQASEIEEKTDELLKGASEESADFIEAEKEPELKKRGRKRKEKKKKSAGSMVAANSEKIESPEDSNLRNDLNIPEDSDISEFSDVAELLDIPEKPKIEKKPGFFSKLLAAFFETDDELELDGSSENNKDNNGVEISEATEDNLEVLKELEEEDKKRKKKGKKKGKKKEDKEDNGNKEEKENNSENEEKGKKEKKPKKEKAPKESIEKAVPEKKLSRKKIMIIAMFNVSMLAGILIAVIFIPKTVLLTDANKAFGNKEYKDTYKLLSGLNLGEDEEVIYKKSAVVLELLRKYEAFENYQILNMELDALNALFQGIVRYDKLLPKAEEYQIVNELEPVYQQIVAAIQSNYGLSEEEAREIIAYDRVTYTKKLESMINGTEFIDPDAPVEEQVVLDDMLPEEESMIQDIQQDLSSDSAQTAEDGTQSLEDSILTAEDGTTESAVGADAVQSGAVQQGTSGSVLYSGTIKDGKVTLSK